MQPQDDSEYVQYCEKILSKHKNQLIVDRKEKRKYGYLAVLSGVLGIAATVGLILLVKRFTSPAYELEHAQTTLEVILVLLVSGTGILFTIAFWYFQNTYFNWDAYIREESSLTDDEIIFKRCYSYEKWQAWRQSKDIAEKIHSTA